MRSIHSLICADTQSDSKAHLIMCVKLYAASEGVSGAGDISDDEDEDQIIGDYIDVLDYEGIYGEDQFGDYYNYG
ncbi:MAG: hypothetical protein EZS28_028598 [Streblomastix strix]|uniref:Uncharacterized protein n=1 Tax=Streblomastix strix TaxID=222440 RepID=A0A5J4UYW3_9EUKA|nr:MAG: hypothetical protein EZS28_028598 [Streblomastix strix]